MPSQASEDTRIIAIRNDQIVGRNSLSVIDECMTDEELLEELNEANITTPDEAVARARALDAAFWDREGDMR